MIQEDQQPLVSKVSPVVSSTTIATVSNTNPSISESEPLLVSTGNNTTTNTSNTSTNTNSGKKPVKIIDHLTFAMAKASKPKYGNTGGIFSGNSIGGGNSGLCGWQTMTKMRQSIRYIVAFLFVFSIGYFGIQLYDVISPTSKSTGLPIDRSDAYRVKVLPTSLNDEQLNALPKETFSYLAMIDAGSSGCRAHVYRYGKLGSMDGPLYILPNHQSKKVKPGLSTFANNPEDAGKSLQGLVDFLKEQVPEADWSVTPIWLKATAGLRMLPTEKSEAILDSVRNFLSNKVNNPFLFRKSWAKVIPGIEEGGFGWIAYNYLKRIIGPKRDKMNKVSPFAVIEMGGASAQVSQLAPSEQEARTIPPEYRFSFTIEGEDYHLYTHSYLGYGGEQARIQFSKILTLPDIKQQGNDPCINAGHPSVTTAARRMLQSVSSSIKQEVTACVRSVASLFSQAILEAIGALTSSSVGKKAEAAANAVSLHLRKAEESLCSNPGPYSFGCVHQPSFVAASENILAFENFFYMASALGVKPVHGSNHSHGAATTATTFPLLTTPSSIRKSSDEFCSSDWNSIQANYPKDGQPKDVNEKTCFLSAFAYSFLVDGIKIPAHKPITIQKEVDGSEIEWALGAAYKETADFLKRTNLRPT